MCLTPTRLSIAPLGTNGQRVTRIGFGSWAIGGGDWAYGWGPQDDAASIAAIRYALGPVGLELTPGDFEEIEGAIRSTGAGEGPASPLVQQTGDSG